MPPKSRKRRATDDDGVKALVTSIKADVESNKNLVARALVSDDQNVVNVLAGFVRRNSVARALNTMALEAVDTSELGS